MRKLTKPAVRCSKCNSITKREEHEYFCDNCEKKLLARKDGRIDLNIFYQNRNTENFILCSCKCYWEFLFSSKIQRKIKSKDFYFFTSPHILKEDLRDFYKSLLDTDFKKLVILSEIT